jgi:hypothetical protein
MTDWLDDKQFYDLMQAYRTAPVEDQHNLLQAFERIKYEIRKQLGERELVIRHFQEATATSAGDAIAQASREARELLGRLS